MLYWIIVMSLFMPDDAPGNLLEYVMDDNVSYVQYWDIESIGSLSKGRESFLINDSPLKSSYFLRITEQIPAELEGRTLRKVVVFSEFIVATADTDQGLKEMEAKSKTAKMNPFKMLYSTKDGPFLFYIGRKSRIIYELEGDAGKEIKKLIKSGIFLKTESAGIFKTLSKRNTRDLYYTWLPDSSYLLASESVSDIEDLKARIYGTEAEQEEVKTREIFSKEQLKYNCSFSDMNARYLLAKGYAKRNYTSLELEKQLEQGRSYMSIETKHIAVSDEVLVTKSLAFNNEERARERFSKMEQRKAASEFVSLSEDKMAVTSVKKISDDEIKGILDGKKKKNR